MSNQYPTIEEVSEIVSEINNEYSDFEYNTFDDKGDYITMMTLSYNGTDLNVECLGQHIWSAENDDRPEDDNDVKLDLKEYLTSSMVNIIYKVETFLMSDDKGEQ